MPNLQQIMKRKQKILKKLTKERIPAQKILNMLSIDEVIDFFINQINHEQGLQEVDPQLLEIVLSNLIERKVSESQEQPSVIKIDILTLGESQLLAFCREKGLVNLHEYLDSIRHKKYRLHSEYGYMLVGTFPDQFQVGPRCTHYHCRTTARKIESQYGIYHNNSEAEIIDDNFRHESDSNFINDSEDESEEIVIKKKKKIKKVQEKSAIKQKQLKVTESSKKKSSMKNALNSDDEEDGIKKNSERFERSSTKKQKKMQVSQLQKQDEKQNELLYQALELLQVNEILQTFDYSTIFQFISQKYTDKLSPIIGEISETVAFNDKKIKRQEKSTKKSKAHRKTLSKSKMNLKQITLEELLVECSKHKIVSAEDLVQWEEKYELEDHPKLAYKLLQSKPNNYIVEGEFNGSTQRDINIVIQNAYKTYEKSKEENQEENESDIINDQQASQQMEYQSNDDEEYISDDSNYSIDQEEDMLGEI